MIEFAAQRIQSDDVTFQRADALNLPFLDGTFDLVVCQFGVMFFPDKVRANREAWRVLHSDGRYLLVSFDRLEFNPVPKAAEDAVVALFPEDPPEYMERGPFSYADPALIKHDLLAAGFTDIQCETVSFVEPHPRPRRRPGFCPWLALPLRNRATRSVCSGAGGQCSHRGSSLLGRQGRADIGACRDRH
jgi:SAM-dependent methyltransferase